MGSFDHKTRFNGRLTVPALPPCQNLSRMQRPLVGRRLRSDFKYMMLRAVLGFLTRRLLRRLFAVHFGANRENGANLWCFLREQGCFRVNQISIQGTPLIPHLRLPYRGAHFGHILTRGK